MTGVVEKSRRIARRGLVVLSVTATMAISGVAFASWTLSGNGTGTAGATNALDLTDIIISVDDPLYPGATSDATITVTNPNPFPVSITAVDFTGSVAVTGDPSGCTVFDDHAVTFANASSLSLFVDANAEDAEVTLPSAVTMGSTAADACQDRTFTQAFTLDAESTTP